MKTDVFQLISLGLGSCNAILLTVMLVKTLDAAKKWFNWIGGSNVGKTRLGTRVKKKILLKLKNHGSVELNLGTTGSLSANRDPRHRFFNLS